MGDLRISDEVAVLVSRVYCLERQIRLWKRIGLAVLVVACAAVLMGQGHSRKVVEADEFRVSDGGKILATLTATPGGPVLALGEEGGQRMALAVTKAGPTLALTDTAGEVRAMLVLASNGPGLSLYDERGSETARLSENAHVSGLTFLREGKSMASFRIDDTGRKALTLSDQNGAPVLIANVDADLPNLELDDHHQRAAQLSVTSSGSGLVLFHPNGQAGVALAINAGSPAFGLIDDHGKALFTAPEGR